MLSRLVVAFCVITTFVFVQDAPAQDTMEPTGAEAPEPAVILDLVEQSLAQKFKLFSPDHDAATTTSDPLIDPEGLNFLLVPLSTDALENELEAWRVIVQEKVADLSLTEWEIFKLNQAEDTVDAAEKPVTDTPTDVDNAVPIEALDAEKQELLDRAAQLREERIEALDRLRIVIDEYENKGGNQKVIDRYTTYANAVSGVKIDVSDTETALHTVTEWVTSEQGGLRILKSSGYFLLAVLAAAVVGRLMSVMLNMALKTTEATSILLRRFLRDWIQRIAIVVGILVGLTAFDINITPLIAGIGAIGFILAFALQNTLSNFASGILIMLQKPFDVGDSVEAAGIVGMIDKVTLFSTYMSTEENKQVIVPNNMIWDGIIVNATGTPTRRLLIEFEVSTEHAIEEVEQTLMEQMAKHPDVMKDPPPEVKLTSIDTETMTFVCWPWVPTDKKDQVRWELVANVARQLDIRRGATKAEL